MICYYLIKDGSLQIRFESDVHFFYKTVGNYIIKRHPYEKDEPLFFYINAQDLLIDFLNCDMDEFSKSIKHFTYQQNTTEIDLWRLVKNLKASEEIKSVLVFLLYSTGMKKAIRKASEPDKGKEHYFKRTADKLNYAVTQIQKLIKQNEKYEFSKYYIELEMRSYLPKTMISDTKFIHAAMPLIYKYKDNNIDVEQIHKIAVDFTSMPRYKRFDKIIELCKNAGMTNQDIDFLNVLLQIPYPDEYSILNSIKQHGIKENDYYNYIKLLYEYRQYINNCYNVINIEELILETYLQCLKHGIKIKQCNNCGTFFICKGRKDSCSEECREQHRKQTAINRVLVFNDKELKYNYVFTTFDRKIERFLNNDDVYCCECKVDLFNFFKETINYKEDRKNYKKLIMLQTDKEKRVQMQQVLAEWLYCIAKNYPSKYFYKHLFNADGTMKKEFEIEYYYIDTENENWEIKCETKKCKLF